MKKITKNKKIIYVVFTLLTILALVFSCILLNNSNLAKIYFSSERGMFLKEKIKEKLDVKIGEKVDLNIGKKIGCTGLSEMNVLVIGIDYRGGDYLYGLADVIRFTRINFEKKTINMVAIPRDLLVEIPTEKFKVPGPYKINQAYFFGTPGMQNYYGEGEGPQALNEVIEYNFGIKTDHYLVVNFHVIVDFIDAIGGIEVNLPQPVYDDALGSFPAGEQTLTGERALVLARIRKNYSDAFRVQNQSIIIRAIFEKLLTPSMILKYPELINQFQDSVLTDIPISDLEHLALCFRDFSSENLNSYEVPKEILTLENIFLPSLNAYSYGFRWEPGLVEWIKTSLGY